MSKRETLLSKMGSGLSDSIGIRRGESTRPIYSSDSAKPPRGDFIRSRSVGEISVDEVHADPNQPRREFTEEEIDHLAADLKTRGRGYQAVGRRSAQKASLHQ